MSDTPPIGTILKNNMARDAIHVAIAPVIAATPLEPGEHVGFVGLGQHVLVSHEAKTLVGIVDPFLKTEVNPGERFFLFLYPGSITSLRHDWTHDAFNPNIHYGGGKGVEVEARRWLNHWAATKRIDYTDLIAGASTGDYICAQGVDMHNWEDGPEDLLLFWQHMETVTGMHFDQAHRERTAFTCSC